VKAKDSTHGLASDGSAIKILPKKARPNEETDVKGNVSRTVS